MILRTKIGPEITSGDDAKKGLPQLAKNGSDRGSASQDAINK
jgi:hypothetical protein